MEKLNRHERRHGKHRPVIEGDTRPFPRLTSMGNLFTSRAARRGKLKFSTRIAGDRDTLVTGIFRKRKNGNSLGRSNHGHQAPRYELVKAIPQGILVYRLPKYMCVN